MATGTVYRHFASKADLFSEVFRRAAQREVDAVADAARRSPDAVETFARRALAGRRLAWALLAEPVDPVVEAERLASGARTATRFERLVGDPLTERRPGRRDRRGPRGPAVAGRTRPRRGRAGARSCLDLPETGRPLMAVDAFTTPSSHPRGHQPGPAASTASTCSRSTCRWSRRSSARAPAGARARCAELGRVWGGEPQELGPAGQRAPAAPAHARPLRQPRRRGRVPPRLAPAHGARQRARAALAAVDERPPGRPRRPRGDVHERRRPTPATAARSR